MKKPPSLDELIRVVSAAAKGRLETPEPGFFTAEQISERLGKSPRQISRAIARAKAAGSLEQREFRILSGTKSRPYPVPHYRLTGIAFPSNES